MKLCCLVNPMGGAMAKYQQCHDCFWADIASARAFMKEYRKGEL